MKIRILWFVLVVSLVFNLFFTLGFLKAKSVLEKARTPEGRAELLEERLDMDESQRETYKKIRKKMVFQVAGLIEQYNARDINDAFWTEITSAEPGPERIHDLLELSLDFRNEFELLRIDSLIELQKLLRPKQHQEFIEMIQKWKGGFEGALRLPARQRSSPAPPIR